MTNKIIKLLAAGLLFMPGLSFAQMTSLQTLQEQREEEQLRQTAAQMAKELEKPAAPAKEEVSDEKIITLHTIVFTESTVLAKTFFDDLTKEYTNKPLSVKDIETLVDKINNQYLLDGFIASRAFLPKQDITEGTLHVSLIEGKVHSYYFSGNKWTRESYLKRYFHWPRFSDLEMGEVQLQTLNFNAHNDAKARVTLAPGPAYGTTDVEVVINEPNLLTGSIFMDNAGQDETGLNRYGAALTLSGITGYRDIFNIGGLKSKGAESLFTSYEIPEPFFNTRIGIGFDYSNTDIVNGPLRVLNVEGDFYNFYAYVKKPFWITPRMTNNLTFNAAVKNGASYISGLTTQTTDITLLNLTWDNIFIFGGGYFFSMLTGTAGVEEINGNKSFWRATYNGEAHKNLIGNLALNLKARAQTAGGRDVLPSSEQFQVGGVNTVRGYAEGVMLADQGAGAMGELQFNITDYLPKIIDNASLYGFFDYSYIFNTDSFVQVAGLDKDLYSAGGGLRLGLLGHIEGNIAFARTLKTNVLIDKTDTKILFFVRAKF